MTQECATKDEHLEKYRKELKEKAEEIKTLKEDLKFQMGLNTQLKASDSSINNYYNNNIEHLQKENEHYKEQSE